MSPPDWRLFGEVFVTISVIMDPLGTVPIFLGLTAGRPAAARRRLAGQAVLVAGSVIATFAVFGQQILEYLGITLAALQGAGGLLLVLVALELLRGGSNEPEEVPDVNVALVPLGTPLLAGPGAIAATIVFVRQADGWPDVTAIALALVAVHVVLWLALRYSAGVLPRDRRRRHPPGHAHPRPAADRDRGAVAGRVRAGVRRGRLISGHPALRDGFCHTPV